MTITRINATAHGDILLANHNDRTHQERYNPDTHTLENVYIGYDTPYVTGFAVLGIARENTSRFDTYQFEPHPLDFIPDDGFQAHNWKQHNETTEVITTRQSFTSKGKCRFRTVRAQVWGCTPETSLGDWCAMRQIPIKQFINDLMAGERGSPPPVFTQFVPLDSLTDEELRYMQDSDEDWKVRKNDKGVPYMVRESTYIPPETQGGELSMADLANITCDIYFRIPEQAA